MHHIQLTLSVKTVKEWLEIRQYIRHLFQLRLLLLDFRPFLQCFMLQRPEYGNAVSHLLNGNLRNRKSSLELSDVSVVLGDLPVRLSQPVDTIGSATYSKATLRTTLEHCYVANNCPHLTTLRFNRSIIAG
jgi:hypothetical protein